MKKLLSLVLTACLLGLLFTALPLNAYADDGSANTDTYYSIMSNSMRCFLSSYFTNLEYNFGMNYRGSCGYVAAAMILSYYDTYLNDDIIPEQYDVISDGNSTNIWSRHNSPGVMKDIVENEDSLSNFEYYSELLALKETSLHAKLITIAGSYNLYDFDDSNNKPANVNILVLNLITQYFLLDTAALMPSTFSMNTFIDDNSNSVRTAVIQQVTAGYPVLLGIENLDDGSAHAVVAYDYDSTTDQLYCHFGWDANTTRVTPESQGYTIYQSALFFTFNLPHKHSNNYAVTTEVNGSPSTEYFCYDNEALYVAEHNYNMDCTYNSISNHLGVCRCGKSAFVPHTFENTLCTGCGFIHSHTYNYTTYSSSHHKSTCECGQEILEPHVLRANVGGGLISRCIFCNAPVITSPLTLLSTQITYVSANGSYILPDGIIVLVDQDIEAFLAGTLTFYNRHTQIM